MEYVLAGYAALPRSSTVSVSACLADLVPAEPDWDDWFPDAAAAARTGHAVYEIGFPAKDVPVLLAEFAAAGAGGLPDRLARAEPPHHLGDGKLLGFEPVGFDCGLCHSWGCLGGLIDDVRRATGIRARDGLIEDEAAAVEAARWLTASGLGDPKVFFWTPAVLIGVPATPLRGTGPG
ncbi:hypothetical protein [Amycolatopsis sp. cmx-4-83]|uniref:hypothetical protein n=1 Tax=Amycolatopsis sp. cmx-4-83 TaxID=2790940 RepID=UPI00397DD64B